MAKKPLPDDKRIRHEAFIALAYVLDALEQRKVPVPADIMDELDRVKRSLFVPGSHNRTVVKKGDLSQMLEPIFRLPEGSLLKKDWWKEG